MGMEHNWNGTQWEWYTTGMAHNGNGTLVHNGTGTQWYWYPYGARTQETWYTTGLGHNGIGIPTELGHKRPGTQRDWDTMVLVPLRG